MALVRIKGHDIDTITVGDSCNRRALQFRNNIFSLLGKLDVIQDDIDIPLEMVAMKSAPASVSWYFDGHFLHYSYSACKRFVENLYVVQKVLEVKVAALVAGEETIEDFLASFSEEHDVALRRKEARETLGLDPGEKDVAVIDKAYNALAREHHPDQPSGDTERFKQINNAHKMLKRELC